MSEGISLEFGQMTGYHRYPPQNPSEFERLCQLIRELRPAHIMEIGSRHGRSLIRLVEAALPSLRKVTVIDLPGAGWGQKESEVSLQACCENLRSRGVEVDLRMIDSHGPEAGGIAAALRDQVDFLFLDGDHTYQGVKQDYEWFGPCVKPGGFIAFHDIAATNAQVNGRGEMVEVPAFWREVRDSTPMDDFASWIGEASIFGIGVIRVRE